MVAKFTATVVDGRLVLDAPTDLPDGTQVDMLIDEWSPAVLGKDAHDALWASIQRGREEAARGEGVSWEEAKAELLARRKARET